MNLIVSLRFGIIVYSSAFTLLLVFSISSAKLSAFFSYSDSLMSFGSIFSNLESDISKSHEVCANP